MKPILINLLGRLRIIHEKSSACVRKSAWLVKKDFALNDSGSHCFSCLRCIWQQMCNRSPPMSWTHYSSTRMMSWSVSYAALRFTTLALLRDISRTAISCVTSARQSRPRRLFRMNLAANTFPVALSMQRFTTANFPLMSQNHTPWRMFLTRTSTKYRKSEVHYLLLD